MASAQVAQGAQTETVPIQHELLFCTLWLDQAGNDRQPEQPRIEETPDEYLGKNIY